MTNVYFLSLAAGVLSNGKGTGKAFSIEFFGPSFHSEMKVHIFSIPS